MQKSKTAIVWFTNNLRVRNNKVLYKACANYDKVIAVYCFNPNHYKINEYGFKKTEKYRAKFIIESVNDLHENLKKLNISLFLCYEHPQVFLPKFCLTHNADALFFQREFTSEETLEIQYIRSSIPEQVEVFEYYDQFLVEPSNISFETRQTPHIFTEFRKKLEKYGVIEQEVYPIKKNISNLIKEETKFITLQDLGFEEFDTPAYSAFPFSGGETEALERLKEYFFNSKKLSYYKKTRNGLLGVDYSSKFSPWLANGCISAVTIYWEVKKYENLIEKNQSTYWLIFELIWRDYFKYLAIKHRNQLFKIDGIKEIDYEWKQDEDLVQKWINGETSEPFVNANMIELRETGWMSNRGRQNVASYFSKELQLDWRIGASYFESMLIDYDVHSNYGNWQYVSGVGNDPRNRKFNIQLQAERYDSNGKFQRTWLQTTLF
ncbi:DASH family cryptochrome [Tenacibaculum sp. MEBiC06402]|uniref:DASH family cryptochrome n=1 Tax=unclassified Tenacibaculum TaxID=2635139 RepID=UPI003B99DC84